MTPPDGEDNILDLIEDVQLTVNVPTLYRGPSVDLRFACKSDKKVSRQADSNRFPAPAPRVLGQALQGCAGDCKSRIFRGVFFPCLAACCTVLRSRWCQSGIKRGAAASRSCLRVACTRRQSNTSTAHKHTADRRITTRTGCRV
jgi:hypothetical protein